VTDITLDECGRLAAKYIRLALNETDSMLLNVSWAAKDLVDEDDLHPDNGGTAASYALEMAARSIMPGASKSIISKLKKALKNMRDIRSNVKPLKAPKKVKKGVKKNVG
jgi:hypothetical protein